ncbi:MAG: hypothetical protein Q4C54_04600 [Clostridia bacterium]|nr:hypothetical protein [Clostridia bacterium]
MNTKEQQARKKQEDRIKTIEKSIGYLQETAKKLGELARRS